MAEKDVLNAYGAFAPNMVAMLGTDIAETDPERVIIDSWAETVSGQILDVGSGTGRWSGHLSRLGFDVEGLEPVTELVTIARAAHPSVPFRQQTIADLAEEITQWSGILAWFSLIHMGPDEFSTALKVLNLALEPGGTLLMSYFSGEQFEAFQHPIALAYRWSAPAMVDAATAAGFQIVSHYADAQRPHAFIILEK